MATHPSTLAHQARTLATADRHGTTWTESEIKLLTAFAADGEPLAEIARALGRTLWATTTRRSLEARGVAPAPSSTLVTSRRSGEGYRGWVEGMGDGEA